MKTFMQITRWVNNIATTILLVLVTYIVVAHFFSPDPPGVGLSNHETIMAVTMGLMFTGAFVAFWKRIIGGVMTLVFYVVFSVLQGSLVEGIVFYTFIVIALVNLILGFYYRKNK
ncbi:MAG: hypothetical protein KDD41_02865 [Flavobacteriales bacterium]|nr:hypothetical protein [Flavobacteriales bacterium]